jgi:CHASE3 domain sensor protein
LNPEEAKQRAEKARQLLDDPMLKESFNAAEEALNRAVRSAKTEQEAFKAAIACQVFDLIKGSIQGHIETARIIEYNFKPTLRERIGL